MSDQKPRTEAEILADWRGVIDEDQAAGDDRSEGWQERSARRDERLAELVEEANLLVEVPELIVTYVMAYARQYLLGHAAEMRRPSQ